MNKRNAMFIALLVAYPVGYLVFLSIAFPRSGIQLRSGWEDRQFVTWHEGIGWFDVNFTEGWSVVWALGQTNESSGFVSGELYATFEGFNYADERGVSGIMIQRSVGAIDSATYPYVIIQHAESSSDPALAFSLAVVDDKGNWKDAGWSYASTLWRNLDVDLREIHNGTIEYISIRFANDFDPYYDGGLQNVYIKGIWFCKVPAQWMSVCDFRLNSSVSSKEDTLTVSASGDVQEGSIVAAQRTKCLNFSLESYPYLKVSVKTSSLDVAARIVVWTAQERSYPILLKTYNDREWHTEIIDVRHFGVTNAALYQVELSLLQLYNGSDSSVAYRSLSFNSWG